MPPAIPEEPRTPESPVAPAELEVEKENGVAETEAPTTLPTFDSHKGDIETTKFLGN
jgi:hypothetical protein